RVPGGAANDHASGRTPGTGRDRAARSRTEGAGGDGAAEGRLHAAMGREGAGRPRGARPEGEAAGGREHAAPAGPKEEAVRLGEVGLREGRLREVTAASATPEGCAAGQPAQEASRRRERSMSDDAHEQIDLEEQADAVADFVEELLAKMEID